MMSVNYVAERGRVTAVEADGLWVAREDGTEFWADFPDAQRLFRFDHLVEVAGIQGPTGIRAAFIQNRSTSWPLMAESFWRPTPYQAFLEAFLGQGRVLPAFFMALPVVNLIVGLFFLIALFAEAASHRGLLRVVGIIFIAFPLVTILLANAANSEVILFIWGLIGVPLTYVLAVASVIRSQDRARQDTVERCREAIRTLDQVPSAQPA